MPRLLLLNGAPAVGKSTLARMWADAHPLALVLDVDAVRSMLGAWRDDPAAAGTAARRLALAMVRAHLRAENDVVVPQLLARLEFLETLEAAAAEAGASFHEVLLVAPHGVVQRRLAERRAVSSLHADDELLTSAGTLAPVFEDYEAGLAEVLRARPRTAVIGNGDDGLDRAYRELAALLGED